MKQDGGDFFGTGLMPAAFKHDGVEEMAISIKVSRVCRFAWFDVGECPLRPDERQSLSGCGHWGCCLGAGFVLCFKACKEVFWGCVPLSLPRKVAKC